MITFKLIGNTLVEFGDLFESWAALEARSEQRAATKIAGRSDLSMQAVYANSMNGTFVRELSLAAANADPQGLTVSPR